jgi:hypothetical protein
MVTTLLALTACNKEDDIDEIFVGRTWYMNGIVINGITSSEETKNFYKEAGANTYFITFSSNTFQGKLSSGVTFSGTWKADGKHQTITLQLQQKPDTDLLFDKQLINILSNVTTYISGADFMHLNDDNQNTIRFGTIRY